jgi:hypothetical protein
VASTLYRYNRSIDLGNAESDTAWWSDNNVGVFRRAGSTADAVSVEECSLRRLAVHVANKSVCHLSDVAWKCTVQWVDHQWHHTTRWWKSDVGIFFSTFLCVLSWSHKWEFLELLASSRVKRGLVAEQDITQHMRVNSNPTAELQLTTHVRRFKCWIRWIW